MVGRARSSFASAALCAGLIAAAGCASDDAAQRDDPVTSPEPEPAPAEEPGQPAPAQPAQPAAPEVEPAPTAEPAPAEEPPAEEPPAAAEPEDDGLTPAQRAAAGKNPDGIDDENPVPTKDGPVKQAFEKATATARENPQQAIQQFVDAAKQNDYFYAAWFNAGAAAEAAGDAATAERYYREALKVRPDYGAALVNLYLLLHRTGKEAEANKVVDAALKSHEKRSGPHLAAAMRAYVQEQPKLVEKEALAAIRIDERAVPAMRLMGWVFFEEGRYETARFAIENALDLEPGNALLHLEHGHVLLKLDEEDKAREAFRKASALRPSLAEAQENFGVLALRDGDKPGSLKALQKAVELTPDRAATHMHYANALRANAKYKEAEAEYAKALELEPDLHAVHFNLGIMYLDNEIPEMDYLARLNKAVEELDLYTEKASPEGQLQKRIKDYRKTLKRKIRREEKKRKRAAERAAIAAEEEAKREAEEAAEAEGEGEAEGEAEAEGEGGAEAGSQGENPGEGAAVEGEGEAPADPAPPPAGGDK